jgi:hypothetical protein
MPLVFVHGVNVRRDAAGAYERRVGLRGALFRAITFEGDPDNQAGGFSILNPALVTPGGTVLRETVFDAVFPGSGGQFSIA